MASYAVWFVLGFMLLIAELLTGTFYLLVIGLAFLAAGVTAVLGLGLVPQLLTATIIAVGGSMWLRQTRFGKLGRRDGDDPIQNMDIGQSIQVNSWSSDGRTRAMYRGAEWDVELAPGEPAQPGSFVIRAIDGNRLIVAARMPVAGSGPASAP